MEKTRPPETWPEFASHRTANCVAVGQAFPPDIPERQAGKPDLRKDDVAWPCFGPLKKHALHRRLMDGKYEVAKAAMIARKYQTQRTSCDWGILYGAISIRGPYGPLESDYALILYVYVLSIPDSSRSMADGACRDF
jgi:hypothetical protein